MDRVSAILSRCGITVLSGDDFTCMATVLIGGCGVISVTGNVAPKDMAAMMDAALAGDLARARELHYQLFPLMQAMFYDSNPVPAKTSLQLMGKIKSASPRLPLCSMDEGLRGKLEATLRRVGVLGA